jgi:hypothetical protein
MKPQTIPHSDERPMIPVEYGRNANGDISSVRFVPFKPGLIINRLGRKYVVDAKGTQHRVKSPFSVTK